MCGSQGKLPSQLAAPTQDTLIPRFWSQEPTRCAKLFKLLFSLMVPNFMLPSQGTCFAGPRLENGQNCSWWMVDLGQDHQVRNMPIVCVSKYFILVLAFDHAL